MVRCYPNFDKTGLDIESRQSILSKLEIQPIKMINDTRYIAHYQD